MEMSVNERIIVFIKKLGIKRNDFASSINMKIGTLNNKLNGVRNFDIEDIKNILLQYEVLSPAWLLTGNGDMFKTELSQINKPKSVEEIYEEQTINLYNVDAAAKLKTLFDQKNHNIIGKVLIPDMPKCDGAVNVKGDSMYPLLRSGDIVAYKEVNVDMRNIFFGEMYLVSIDLDGEEYLSVKYVQKSDLGDDWIKLVSHNPNHQPKDFPVSSIKAMGLIKFTIRFNTMK